MISYFDFTTWRNRPYLEAAGDKFRDVQMPIPSVVFGVLRNIPAAGKFGGKVVNLRSAYANTLKWIFNMGLYEASRLRHLLAEKANEEFKDKLRGSKFYDHEMYSKEAHDWWSQKGIDLAGFYEREYASNPWKHEPEAIDLGMPGLGNSIKITLPLLNGYLENQGMQPFFYGGYTGLIEYIETGRDPITKRYWAKRRSPSDRFDKKHHDRIGLDVAGARISFSDNEKQVVYSFDNFTPPISERVWNRTLANIMKYSNEQVQNALDGKPVNPSDIINKELFQRIVDDPSIVKKTPYHGKWDKYGMYHGYEVHGDQTTKDYEDENFGSPKDFYGIAFLINLGIDAYAEDYNLANPSSNKITSNKKYPVDFSDDAQLKYVLTSIFRGYETGNLKIKPIYYPNAEASKSSSPSKRYTSYIIEAGQDRLQQMSQEEIQQQIQKFANGHTRMTRIMGIVPKDMNGYDLSAVEDVVSDALGHTPSQLIQAYSTDAPDYDDFATHVTTRDDEGDQLLTPEILDNYIKKGYRVVGPVDDKGYPAKGSVGAMINQDIRYPKRFLALGKDGKWYVRNPMEGNIPEQPLSPAQRQSPSPVLVPGEKVRLNRSKYDRNQIMARHSDADKVITMMQDDPEGFGFDSYDALDKWLWQAAKYAKDRISTQKNKKADDEDLKMLAQQSLMFNAGSYEFRIGDLDNPKLPAMLAQAGVEDPERAQRIIDAVKVATQRGGHGRNIEVLRKRLGDLWPVFAKNGKNWRMQKAVQYAVDQFDKEAAKSLGSGGETGGEDEDLGTGFSVNEPITFNQFDMDDETSDSINNIGRLNDINPIISAARVRADEKPFRKIGELFYQQGTGGQRSEFNNAYKEMEESLAPYRNVFASAAGAASSQLNTILPNEEATPENKGYVYSIGDFIRAVVLEYKANVEIGKKPDLRGIREFLNKFRQYSGKYFTPALLDSIVKELDAAMPQNDIEIKVAHNQLSPDEFEKAYNESDPELKRRLFSLVQNKPEYLKRARNPGVLQPTADSPRMGVLSGKLRKSGITSTEPAKPAAPIAKSIPAPVPAHAPAPKPTPAPVAKSATPSASELFNQLFDANESNMNSFKWFQLSRKRKAIMEQHYR